ncbi:MAG: tetratricopeptide repeat protein [Pseudomonadota bacterium]
MSDKEYLEHLASASEHLRAERIAEARVELETVLRLKPGDAKALSLLGVVCFRLGEYQRAKEAYEELVARQPDDPCLRLNLGLVHLKMSAVDQAIAELMRVCELQPENGRAMGYLGLAYARKGEYRLARDAFSAAGQEELAREMDQYGNGGKPAGSRIEQGQDDTGQAVSAMVPSRAAEHHAAADVTLEAGVTAAGWPSNPCQPAVKVVAAARATSESAEHLCVPEAIENKAASSSDGHLAITVMPESFDDAKRSPPTLVSVFATARLILPDDGEAAFEQSAGGTLIIRVRDSVFSRTDGVVVTGGELYYKPAHKRVRGRMATEPFGSEARPMFVVSGTGYLVAEPLGGVFAALQLANDIVYVREDLVFAFEDQLRWENGAVPGSSRGILVVQFRGEGGLVIRTRRQPFSVKLSQDRVLYVDATALAGWIGRVVPRVVAPSSGGDASSVFVECTGEGVVLVEDLETTESA